MIRKEKAKARIGLYSIGLKAYWTQFPGLRETLLAYGRYIEDRLGETCQVCNFGLVDQPAAGKAAGEWFSQRQVDLILVHSATYCTSASILPVHQICGAPAVILNLQPVAAMDYPHTNTGEWLACCGACPAPELVNALNRCGIRPGVISGLLGMEEALSGQEERPEAARAWEEIQNYLDAAMVKRALLGAKIGFLGGNYAGMLDLYSDATLLQKGFRVHIEPIEMCDLAACLREVTEGETAEKLEEIRRFFAAVGGSPADPIAGEPAPVLLRQSAAAACALDRLTGGFGLDALAYYYHGAGGGDYESLAAQLIVGSSLLTAAGIPCAGEGDLKTAVAMKICDLLGTGGSFTEIVAADYNRGTILLGHDGPFHMAIAAEKPFLRGMKLYHGKRGEGISVEAKVKPGPVTLLGVTQTAAGGLRCIISEGEAVEGQTLMIGNTQTQVKFDLPIDEYYNKWFAQSPTHHCAMSVGRNAGRFQRTAELLGIEWARI
ncbi:MAG: arabinose isomerase [Clostridiales bacterium]|nr:arabinose isomerase [Clostridiales bacterium]